ncbi:MAG TPA: CrcB family protein [Nocardioides sp.]|nr:CrcB family protein [Nocardioides sp.]
MTVLLVALGAAVGAPLRYAAGQLLDDRLPHGTLLVNVIGSLLLGLSVGLSADGGAAALVGTGFCGGLTTYSALAVQTRDLGPRRGAAYGVATVGLGLLACSVGLVLAP